MSTKKILKKIWFARETHRKISVLIRNLSALGVWPFRILRASKIPRYFTEMKSFKSKGGKISHFYPILSALIGAVIFGVGGFLGFMTYGGRNCDTPGKNCDCFCCNLFGLRGYESCADFGFWIGEDAVVSV